MRVYWEWTFKWVKVSGLNAVILEVLPLEIKNTDSDFTNYSWTQIVKPITSLHQLEVDSISPDTVKNSIASLALVLS
jgi:hypothetical protein